MRYRVFESPWLEYRTTHFGDAASGQKSTFSQPFKQKCMSAVVRIGVIIFYIRVSYEKPTSPYCLMLCIGEAAGEI